MNEIQETLNSIATNLENGLNFDEALSKVSKQFDHNIAQAFGQVMTQVESGTKRRVAIKDMANQLNMPAMTAFVDDVIKADEEGTSILDTVKKHAQGL